MGELSRLTKRSWLPSYAAVAGIFHARRQLWVHVAYDPYRSAYKRAFPDENIDHLILSHAMNRVTAVHKGFDFVRITPASRAANSSSSFSEQWAVELHGSPGKVATRRIRPPYTQYADLSDEGQKFLERKDKS